MAGSLCTSVPLKLSITSLNVLFFLVLNMDIWELYVNEFQFIMFERRLLTTATTVGHFFLHDRDFSLCPIPASIKSPATIGLPAKRHSNGVSLAGRHSNGVSLAGR